MDMGTGIPHAEGLSLGEIWRYHSKFEPQKWVVQSTWNSILAWFMVSRIFQVQPWDDDSDQYVGLKPPGKMNGMSTSKVLKFAPIPSTLLRNTRMFTKLWNVYEPWGFVIWVPLNTFKYHNTHCWTKFVKNWENYDLTLKMMLISWGFKPLPQPCIHVRVIESLRGWNVIPMMALFFHETAPKSIERAQKTSVFCNPKNEG